MSCLIKGGKIDKNFIFPIIALISIIIENTIYKKTSALDNYYSHIFIICIGQSLGKALSFIPFIIFYLTNKNLGNIIKHNKSFYKKEYIEKYKYLKIKKYGLIVLFSFLNFLINIIYYRIILSIELDFWLFDILFIILFSFLILKIKLYKHQYFSTIIIFICGLTLNIINLTTMEKNYINIFFSFLTETVFCLNIVVNKYLMENVFCSPYEICFYDGFISLLLFIIALIVSTNINIEKDDYSIEYKGKYYIDNFYAYCDIFNIKEFFILIFEIIYYCVYYLFSLLTIKYYTATHYLIILIFDCEVTFLFDTGIKWRLCLTMIVFLIILFMLLVFNEIIELNCYGFQKDTKSSITERAKLESINDEENNDCSEYLENESYIIEFDKKIRTSSLSNK